MLTTTEPIRGRTYDDGIEMPAAHVLYEATKSTGKKKVPFQQCGGSGMFIPDPGSDFFPSRIPDPNCLNPGSRILIKEFKYFNPKKAKKWFLSSKKYDPLP
jgi:hypothetical protein